MKPIVITPSKIRLQLWILLACFVVSNLINLYAIIKFDAPFSELFWSLGFVFVSTAVIYGVILFITVVVCLIKNFLNKE